jgi:hypothetical protein
MSHGAKKVEEFEFGGVTWMQGYHGEAMREGTGADGGPELEATGALGLSILGVASFFRPVVPDVRGRQLEDSPFFDTEDKGEGAGRDCGEVSKVGAGGDSGTTISPCANGIGSNVDPTSQGAKTVEEFEFGGVTWMQGYHGEAMREGTGADGGPELEVTGALGLSVLGVASFFRPVVPDVRGRQLEDSPFFGDEAFCFRTISERRDLSPRLNAGCL